MKKILKSGMQMLGHRPYHTRHFRDARLWSNREIEKFGSLYTGDVINVSAWEDKDKEGRLYRQYFPNCAKYFISNYGTDQGVLQGAENEFFVDLEAPLDPALAGRFQVVFNHTTLEHVFDFNTAFDNLCAMSSDTVMIVVPWLQQLHANYGDYWRFSPQALAKLFDRRGFKTLYLSWTEQPKTAVYVLGIASKHPELWKDKIGAPIDVSKPEFLMPPKNGAGSVAF